MKKILAILLAATMLLSLAACGGKDDPKPSGGSDTPPAASQGEPSQAPGDEEDESQPQENSGTASEDPLFGWTEDDFKPDDIFADMKYEEGMGYFISTTEPLGAEGYKAWYHKLASKVEAHADGGEYTIVNVPDLDEYLSKAVESFESGLGSFYVMWEYTSDGQKIGITTMVVDLERTEEVLYFYIHESKN